jgi:hypothetical protein
LAARFLVSDAPIGALQAFAQPEAGVAEAPAWAPVFDTAARTLVYAGPGWVGGRLTDVACWRSGESYLVAIPGLPNLIVVRGGCALAPGGQPIGEMTDALVEALLGPGLILALALNGVFTFHAGAVVSRGRAALLIGESGAGKSTVTRALTGVRGFTFLADDALPAEIADAGVVALPHFPQLKLPDREQYSLGSPDRVPVEAIFLLAPDTRPHSAVVLEPLAPREAFLALAGHTMAARLFDAPLLARHTEFCSAALASVAVHRVVFPQRLHALPAVVEAISARLSRIQ